MSFDKQHVMGAAAEASEPALVSDQAPAGLAPTGFDQAQGPWRCFHCGDTFTDEQCARIHFGRDEESDTACRIKAGAEHGLIAELRRLENELADVRQDIASESTESARFYYSQATRHNRQIMLAEESGYEKGLADGRADALEASSRQEERLREALGRIAALNDLSGVPEADLDAETSAKLYECEIIARAALDGADW